MALGDRDLKVKTPRVFPESVRKHWIKPGEVRNPKGRGKKIYTAEELRARDAKKDLRNAAKEYTDEALQTLVTIMRDEFVKPAVRVTAANIVLERGHGKATQYIETKSTEVYERMSDIELISFITGKPVEELKDIQEARENHFLELEASGTDPNTF